MSEFNQVFNQAQQFLILQAYIDSQLSAEELMNFTLLETMDNLPVVFYSAGVMLIQPDIDLDQFTHKFYPRDSMLFHFDEISEAEQVENDLIYLYSNIE